MPIFFVLDLLVIHLVAYRKMLEKLNAAQRARRFSKVVMPSPLFNTDSFVWRVHKSGYVTPQDVPRAKLKTRREILDWHISHDFRARLVVQVPPESDISKVYTPKISDSLLEKHRKKMNSALQVLFGFKRKDDIMHLTCAPRADKGGNFQCFESEQLIPLLVVDTETGSVFVEDEKVGCVMECPE